MVKCVPGVNGYRDELSPSPGADFAKFWQPRKFRA